MSIPSKSLFQHPARDWFPVPSLEPPFSSFLSRSELPQVMVCVKVRPSEPGALRHSAEDRVCRPGGRVARSGLAQQRFDLRDVAGEVERFRASDRLIDFGPRGNSSGPGKRHVQHEPLEERAVQQTRGLAHRLVTCGHAKRVSQVADHLMRRHASPLRSAVGANASQPLHERVPIARLASVFMRRRGPPAAPAAVRHRRRETPPARAAGRRRPVRAARGTREAL